MKSLRVAIIVGLMFSMSACTSAADTQTALTPFTYDQAVRLSDVLRQNYLSEGATFTLTIDGAVDVEPVVLTGHVDWVGGQARAHVTGVADAYGVLTDVAWTSEAVAEYRPELVSQLAQRNETPDTYFLRRLDPTQQRIDRLMQLVLQLASPHAENAQLLLQQDGAGFVGIDALDGETIEGLRYGQQSLYWVSVDTGQLRRFEGNDVLGEAPFRILFHTFGPQTVGLLAVSSEPARPLTR